MTKEQQTRVSLNVIMIAAAVASVLAVAAITLAVVNFGRVGAQVRRLDNVAQDNTVRLIASWEQRRQATRDSCDATEQLKADARLLLTFTGYPRGRLPQRRDHTGAVFAPADCNEIVEQRVPARTAPPGADRSIGLR